MRRIVLLLAFTALSAAGETRFLSPQEGAQLFGLTVVEVETDAQNVDRVELYVDGTLAGAVRTPPFRLAFDFGDSLRARNLTAKVWSNGFTTSEEETIFSAAPSLNESLTVDLVEVPLRVRSRRPIRAADLRVAENGIEQVVRDVTMERPAAHFALVVDRSLSMRNGRLEAALAAIEQQLAQLRTGDTASLVLFNHQVGHAVAIRRGEPLRVETINAAGGTSLRDALASVASTERTYAIVITDGGDRNSALSDEEALRRISGTRTVVNAIVTGTSHASFLDRAAENTGGSVVNARVESIDEALSRLLADINSRHLLVYQSNAEVSGWRRIEVHASKRGIDILAARKGYFSE